jgi:hypothetical protein
MRSGRPLPDVSQTVEARRHLRVLQPQFLFLVATERW